MHTFKGMSEAKMYKNVLYTMFSPYQDTDFSYNDKENPHPTTWQYLKEYLCDITVIFKNYKYGTKIMI